MRILLNPSDLADYRLFLRAKTLPRYRIAGGMLEVPDEYAHLIGVAPAVAAANEYTPLPGLFDYQRDIARLAVLRRKFAVFAECGLGKTLILLEFARHAAAAQINTDRPKILIVCPLMVVRQTAKEIAKFYGDALPAETLSAAWLNNWLADAGCPGQIGITNYEAIRDGLPANKLGGIILDESSLLKSHYGKWGVRLIDMGRGVPWKLCATGTPAPNDRIEYANHAVFLDQFPNVNSFLAKFFVNRGQTQNRWELKAHALRPFYTSLSHWCVFLTNPAVYGWKDNVGTIPPTEILIEHVDLIDAQRVAASAESGDLFGTAGGIGSRSKLAQIAKGGKGHESLKPKYIVDRINSWKDSESTIVWCLHNAEQDHLAKLLPDAGNIDGKTSAMERVAIIEKFQAGECRILISKPKILGFGLNLEIATRQVFSGLQDSWEQFHQAIKRSNRIGSTKPLRVHLPVTDIERPMIDTVLRKAKRVDEDTAEQERLFRETSINFAKGAGHVA